MEYKINRKRLLGSYIALIVCLHIFSSCKNQASQDSGQTGLDKADVGYNECDKCDTAIIKLAANTEVMTKDQTLTFLCSFQDSCDWSMQYYSKEANLPFTYQELADELLIVYFQRHFRWYMNILSDNPSIDKEYLFEIMSRYSSDNDLPYKQIHDSLMGISYDDTLKNGLLEIFDGKR